MAVWFTADTHFSDPRVLALDKRPFRTLAEHDEALVARWREIVAEDDVVWHLGDFARDRPAGRAREILARLPGEKRLVVGNNDPESVTGDPAWAWVGPYAETTVGETRLVLCHYPFRTWRDSGRGVLDLHGHSHGRLSPIPRQYDVGVDVFDGRPVSLETIRARRPRRRSGPGRSDMSA